MGGAESGTSSHNDKPTTPQRRFETGSKESFDLAPDRAPSVSADAPQISYVFIDGHDLAASDGAPTQRGSGPTVKPKSKDPSKDKGTVEPKPVGILFLRFRVVALVPVFVVCAVIMAADGALALCSQE
uniref:Uncharacterized protein n=1 Tax=Anopheles culicifacies TaxID=139723 RepID=A0A182M540_9DIPT